MSTQTQTGRSRFFSELFESREQSSLAQDILNGAKHLGNGISLLVSAHPAPLRVSSLSAGQLLELFPKEKMRLAEGVTNLLLYLKTETGNGEYYLEALVDELAFIPPFAAFSTRHLKALKSLQKKGLKFKDMPSSFREARRRFIMFAQEINISPEFLLGNLEKALKIMRLTGVRNKTVNVSTLYHNFHSGFFVIQPDVKTKISAAGLLKRASALRRQGTVYEIFKKGEFNKEISKLTLEELNSAVHENASTYDISESEFKKFISVVFAREEKHLKSASALSIKKMLECFKFSAGEETAVGFPGIPQMDELLRWHTTPLGKAMKQLYRDMDWPLFSQGVHCAGNFQSHRKDPKIQAQTKKLKKLARGYNVYMQSGRGETPEEQPLTDLSSDDALFDLYCEAALEKQSLKDLLTAAIEILELMRKLGNHDTSIHLHELLRSRFKGESFAVLFHRHGVLLAHSSFLEALQKLKNLSGKAALTIQGKGSQPVPLKDAGVNEFREAVISMAQRLPAPQSPENVLAALLKKIIPEIENLPDAVIAKRTHDLHRIVELAMAGIPPRYPLRRPWTKIHLDPLTFMTCAMEPGVRNCQGCPVNNLYERVIQTSLALGFKEIITYEATGCFEVYSGIWPYTGKKFPSLHGVFGGAASEMLGGLAAKQARLNHALKSGKKSAGVQKVLHLGWGGDGATFDIGFGNISGLYSRLQKFTDDETPSTLLQRAIYVCYDNEGYQNTGNQFSAATPPGSSTTTNPSGAMRPMGTDLRKKPIVEIMAGHGISLSARMNIHRVELISRVVARALEDGNRGAFIHFLQPCTTGWKLVSDDITYELSFLAEEGGMFAPVTIEHGVPYLETYPLPRNPEQTFLEMQARFKHLHGAEQQRAASLKKVIEYYRSEWLRNLHLTGFDGEIPGADRLDYLDREHRQLSRKA